MADMMTFPETWEEFEKSYGFDDSEEVYTNGSRLIPSFRVKQWLDHIAYLENERQATVSSDCISRQAAIDALDQIFDRCEEIEAHLPEGDPDRTGYKMYPDYMTVWKYLHQLPSAQPERKIELQGDESAIEILSELRSWFSCFDEKEGLAYHALSLAIREIKANHTERSEHKKGKWLRSGNCIFPYECDQCEDTNERATPFCPNCGADMREGDSE